MTKHLGFPATLESPIAEALRRIRLRFDVPRPVSGRWQHVSVKHRAENQAGEIAGAKRRYNSPKRWQAERRESPREEWMSWRGSMVRYGFAGWMRFYHGKAPPLVGRALLYDPFSPRKSPFDRG